MHTSRKRRRAESVRSPLTYSPIKPRSAGVSLRRVLGGTSAERHGGLHRSTLRTVSRCGAWATAEAKELYEATTVHQSAAERGKSSSAQVAWTTRPWPRPDIPKRSMRL